MSGRLSSRQPEIEAALEKFGAEDARLQRRRREHLARGRQLLDGGTYGQLVEYAQAGLALAEEAAAVARRFRERIEAAPMAGARWLPLLLPFNWLTFHFLKRRTLAEARANAAAFLAFENRAAERVIADCEEHLRSWPGGPGTP